MNVPRQQVVPGYALSLTAKVGLRNSIEGETGTQAAHLKAMSSYPNGGSDA